MKIPTGVAKNTKTGRFHPVPFRLVADPNFDDRDVLHRYQSIGYHLEGFATLEAAKEYIRDSSNTMDIDMLSQWNGEGTPQIATWLPLSPLAAMETQIILDPLVKCILVYRRTLRGLLWKAGIPNNPGVTDDWILDEISKLVQKQHPA